MSKIYRTDIFSKFVWIIFHPLKWHRARNVRQALDSYFEKAEKL